MENKKRKTPKEQMWTKQEKQSRTKQQQIKQTPAGQSREKQEQIKQSRTRQEQGKKNSAKQSSEKANQVKQSRAKQTETKHSQAIQVPKEQICPVAKKCGGCDWINKPYKEQLAIKSKRLREMLSPFCKTEAIIPMENPLHYRNKVHAVFGHDRKHNIISGIYEAESHRIVPIDSCMLENEKADAIIVSVRELCKSFKIKSYNEDSGYGLLRHVLVRTGYTTGQIMVVLVLSSPIMPSKNNFVKALRKLHPEITTIVVNVNNQNTSMILGDKEQVIYGKGYIEDVLCGKTFRISPKSFYQVNPVQTEILYKKALEFADLKGTERVLDAYCGTGTIGMIASDHAGEVIGVELNADAVRDARINAKCNQIKNIQIYQNDAGKFLVEMAEQKVVLNVLFMDPPRAGSDEAFLSSVARIAPQKIVYISCNPETLVRDLKYLVKHGYKVERGVGVDMFPWTGHVETVVMLSHKKTDSVINVKMEYFGESKGKGESMYFN